VSDITTAVELLGPSSLALKMLGPTADYFGQGMRSLAETRVNNIRSIFNKAECKTDASALLPSGAVAPRVLAGIMGDGSYVTDELFQDYFGGVLLSSHSESGRDDRSSTYVQLLSRLSSYQIKAHYLLYCAARAACLSLPEVELSDVAGRERVGDFFLRFPQFFFTLDLSDDEMGNLQALLNHAFVGLHREGLIGARWHFSTDAENVSGSIAGQGHVYTRGGLVYRISPFGIELFCAAHGFSGESASTFTDPDSNFEAGMSTSIETMTAERIAIFPMR
jgi:hypothetical protein